jgi:hypothetical protein
MSNCDTHVQESSVGDAILSRLDREHLVAHEKASTIMSADIEADVEGEGKELKNAWLEFDSIGYAAASFPADTLKSFKAKGRILARQGGGLSAGEIMEEGGNLRRLAVSVLQDAIELYGADYTRSLTPRRRPKTHDGTPRARVASRCPLTPRKAPTNASRKF